eukprot:COSAG01_NODE_58237_length_307_cov_0.793269_1_plen_46_part_10
MIYGLVSVRSLGVGDVKQESEINHPPQLRLTTTKLAFLQTEQELIA